MTALLAFLTVFTVVVLVHELGHHLVAKRLGVKVYEFSIGFPMSPKVATLFRSGETEFTVRMLPLGGFVSFSKDGSEEFLGIEGWRKALIVSADPAFNVAFAFITLAAAFMAGDGLPIWSASLKALYSVFGAFSGTVRFLAGLFSGGGSTGAIAGPVGIAVMAGEAFEAGLFELLYFTGILGLSLGILNLLPLPALDGGHLVIVAFEHLIGRPLDRRAYEAIGAVGISFFIIVTLLVSYNDILKLLA